MVWADGNADVLVGGAHAVAGSKPIQLSVEDLRLANRASAQPTAISPRDPQ
jgi:hypothetical protein